MYNRSAPAWRASSEAPRPEHSRMPDSSPLVSIIVPTRDRCALLAETMESVRRQTYANWESIVVDDRSTDGTVPFVRDLARHDPRIKLHILGEPKSGAPAARNLGLRESTGPLVVFLDSDDLLAPHCLARRVEVMAAHPDLDFAVFPCQVFRDQIDDMKLLFNADTGKDDLDRLLSVDVPWQTTSPIWRRAALQKVGPWDEQAVNAQDWEFHIRALLALLRYERFGPDPDVYWRRPSAQRDSIGKTSATSAHFMRARVDTIRKIRQLIADRGLLTEARRKMFAALYFRSARNLAQRASRRDARDAWLIARKDGVITRGQAFSGWLHFLLSRWNGLGNATFAYLQRSWPAEYFVPESPTLLRAPMPHGDRPTNPTTATAPAAS